MSHPRSRAWLRLVMIAALGAGWIVGGTTQAAPRTGGSAETETGEIASADIAFAQTDRLADPEADGIIRALGAAKVVGLGEATHGTREFSLLRKALVMRLAERGQLRTIALEATYANMLPIDRYVKGGEGDVGQLLAGMKLWPWRTAEMRDLIEAVRRHNAALADPREKVGFVGYDIQQIDAALAYVRERYASRKGFSRINAEMQKVQEIASLPDFYTKLDPASIATLRRVASFVRKVGAKDAEALMVARNLDGAADMWGGSDIRTASARRELLSAEMVKAIADGHADGATIVWAHNGHVMTFATKPEGDFVYTTLGRRLRDFFGESYYALGLGFRQGGVLAFDPAARRLRAFTTGAARDGSLDLELTRDAAARFVDLRSPAIRVRYEGREVAYRQIEASVTGEGLEQAYVEDDVTRLFDGWLSVGEATASTMLAN